ncbi:aminotransferase class I/II-fold pyridoxal phosphate-dependent enzyme [Saccharolobus islandicus]|uniref:Cystathionine gamma-synthase n=2 Tax=Saccharolobus islandicus TaxID=43080 RepID=C3MU22_SACI4|nr:aminotransferase class I/II-fold pyridoxal phosphate-dependent enzyme [Sulfolobus islandicus]ACP37056.1 Cystathionine gamma-synthase [Sulfolobus islandicus M.14.25]ACP54195.1 Cystathionine gamma-synthase [Sulfolobus islandicus M.16.27]
MKDATRTVREDIDEATGAITTPIYQTTAYHYPEGEKYRYSREANPTVLELTKKIVELENAEMGVAFSSGMGAISTSALALLKPGNSVLVHRDMFGRSYRFFTDYLKNWGVNVDASNPGSDNIIEKAKSKRYDVIFVENITNPLLRVVDITELSKVAKERGSILVVDATFSTPINQKPLELGADIVVHSASKFLAGHNDVIAGLAAGYGKYLNVIDQMRRTLGTSLDAHAAYLTLRGIKTLKIRMDVINRNAEQIAEFLEGHPKVVKVYYPGLKSHVDYEIARKVLKGFGGVLSFEVNGGQESALKVMKSLKLIIPAQTLGGVNSVISHPATMSHRTLSLEERKIVGITDSLLRLSVGIEDVNDLIEDLDRALGTLY